MAIINTRTDGVGQLIETLLNKEKLEQSERALKLKEREAKLQEGQMQGVLQQLFQEFQGGGGGFAQSFVPQTPNIAQAFEGGLSAEEMQDPALLGMADQVVEARKTYAQRVATEQALARIAEESRRIGDPSILSNARTALNLTTAGVDSSIINSILPPDAKELIDIQAERVRLRGINDVRAADKEATRWLQQQSIVPDDVSFIPGAAKSLLAIAEARAEDAIDWQKQGLDYVTGRVGDPVSGSMFATDAAGNITIGQSTAVTVEQAVNEWKAIIKSYAPAPIREQVLEQLDSDMFVRRLENERALLWTTDILREAGSAPDVLAQVREILEEDFTPAEITTILSKAGQRARRPQR